MNKINNKQFLIHLINEHCPSHYFQANKELKQDLEVLETLLNKNIAMYSFLTYKLKNNKKIFELALKIANKIENLQDRGIAINTIICNNISALYKKLKKDFDDREKTIIINGAPCGRSFEPLNDFEYIKTCWKKIYNYKQYRKDFLDCK